jgi:hypothetical protein
MQVIIPDGNGEDENDDHKATNPIVANGDAKTS